MKRGRRRNYEFRQRPRDPAAVFPGADGSRSSGPGATGSGAGSRHAARGGGGLVDARRPHLSPGGGRGGSEPCCDSARGGGPRPALLLTQSHKKKKTQCVRNKVPKVTSDSRFALPNLLLRKCQHKQLTQMVTHTVLLQPLSSDTRLQEESPGGHWVITLIGWSQDGCRTPDESSRCDVQRSKREHLILQPSSRNEETFPRSPL
ncbi:uncharacterized protein [Eschrichtius robustus]|uniref:uncharacterized protein n=1 Tax=Eschrichtius robustus TaxID=9764 RepID=UPI0035C0FDC1